MKSCDIYVYVYSLKFYNNFFEINIFNSYNIFTSKDLTITIFIEEWNLKYGLNLIQNLNFNFNVWPKILNQFKIIIKKEKCICQILNIKLN